jgi:hypothetical protein
MHIYGDLSLSGSGSGIVFPDGSIQTSAGITYARTVLVSPAETAAQSGAALRSALSAINDATEAAPVMVKIEPGVYDLGTQPLQMKTWVDIEGSGRLMTLLKGSVDNPEAGVVIGSSNSELRWLSVENVGPGNNCVAIFSMSCTPSFFQVSARASGGNYNFGILNGLGASPRILHVTASASGSATENHGIYNIFSQPVLFCVEAGASGGNMNYGLFYFGAFGSMNQVSAEASGGDQAFGVYFNQASPSVTALHADVSGAGANNYGIYLYNSASPTIRNAGVDVRSGPSNTGVYMASCSPEIIGLTADISGDGENVGVYTAANSTPTLSQIDVSVSGGISNCAVYNHASSPVLTHAQAVASGADSHGIHIAAGGGTLKAHHASFRGQTYSVSNDVGGAALELGACKLDGAVTGLGTCVNCYDGSFNPLDSSCH